MQPGFSGVTRARYHHAIISRDGTEHRSKIFSKSENKTEFRLERAIL
jgi:hypothetical protein